MSRRSPGCALLPGADVEPILREEAGLLGPPVYRVAFERRRISQELLEGVVQSPALERPAWLDRLGSLLARPLTGLPVLASSSTSGCTSSSASSAPARWWTASRRALRRRDQPFFERIFAPVPWDWLRALFVGDYGVLTLGVRYAVAIILPVVGTFFLFFSVLEDTGYFPRLALLVDRSFKRIGLSGRAVIPMVLGFACDTMATMVTRTLETKRERVLATLLLALAIPCSAQLGVIIAVLAGSRPRWPYGPVCWSARSCSSA
jgi:ferrous iron transport protein B